LRGFLNFLRLAKSSLVGRTTPPNSMFSGRKNRQKIVFKCPQALTDCETSKLSVLGRGVMRVDGDAGGNGGDVIPALDAPGSSPKLPNP
jgi:hypothetical protein